MPLLWVSLGWLAGIVLGYFIAPPWYLITILAALSFGLVIGEQRLWKNKAGFQKLHKIISVPASAILLVFFLGILRTHTSSNPWAAKDLAFYNERGEYTFTAWVSAPPDKREDSVYLDVTVIELEDSFETDPAKIVKAIGGKARLKLLVDAKWKYGDLIRFTARLKTPADEDGFSYREYLSRLNIHSVVYYPRSLHMIGEGYGNPIISLLEKGRQKALAVIFRQFPPPESALLAGVLLGLDNDLPPSLQEAYRQTGTAHIIAISGSNMVVLAGLFLFIFSRLFSLKWSVALAVIGIFFYTLFVGGSPSVIRAAMMSGLAFGGSLIGRRRSGMTALFLTAAVMCLFNPLLISDAGFQLSFAATFGLRLFAQPLADATLTLFTRWIPVERSAKLVTPISSYLLFTIAAQVTTLPVIALHFGRISTSSLLANPLVLPAQPPLLILGGASTIAGMAWPFLGKLTSLLAWPLLAYTNRLVELLAMIQGGSLVLHPQISLMILVFLFLFILLFVFHHFFSKKFGKFFIWLVFCLVLAAVSAWSIAFHRADGRMHVHLVQAGDESSLFILTPEGKSILVDPGKNINELSADLSRQLSPWNFHLDEVWLTDRNAVDQIEALHEKVPIYSLALTLPVFQPTANQELVHIPAGILTYKISSGDPIQLGKLLQLEVLASDETTSALLLRYDEISILVPNGVDFAAIKEASPDILDEITLLILEEKDVSYIPVRVWKDLSPQVILWNDTALSPEEDWIGTDRHSGVEFVSDGVEYSITRK